MKTARAIPVHVLSFRLLIFRLPGNLYSIVSFLHLLLSCSHVHLCVGLFSTSPHDFHLMLTTTSVFFRQVSIHGTYIKCLVLGFLAWPRKSYLEGWDANIGALSTNACCAGLWSLLGTLYWTCMHKQITESVTSRHWWMHVLHFCDNGDKLRMSRPLLLEWQAPESTRSMRMVLRFACHPGGPTHEQGDKSAKTFPPHSELTFKKILVCAKQRDHGKNCVSQSLKSMPSGQVGNLGRLEKRMEVSCRDKCRKEDMHYWVTTSMPCMQNDWYMGGNKRIAIWIR